MVPIVISISDPTNDAQASTPSPANAQIAQWFAKVRGDAPSARSGQNASAISSAKAPSRNGANGRGNHWISLKNCQSAANRINTRGDIQNGSPMVRVRG